MSDQYRVVGHCALITQDTVNGPTKLLLMRGAVVGPGAKRSEVEHNLSMGLIEPVGGAVPAAVEPVRDAGEDPAADPAPAGPVGRPSQADNKAAWVEWAVSQGADRDEATKASKAELIDTYGK